MINEVVNARLDAVYKSVRGESGPLVETTPIHSDPTLVHSNFVESSSLLFITYCQSETLN